MNVTSDQPDRQLTSNQQMQLRALLTAGATSRLGSKRASVSDLQFASTQVIGKLRDMGLADSKSVRRLGRAWTEYWLTEAGVETARALAQGQA